MRGHCSPQALRTCLPCPQPVAHQQFHQRRLLSTFPGALRPGSLLPPRRCSAQGIPSSQTRKRKARPLSHGHPSNSAEHSSLISGPALPGSGQQLLAGPAAGWAGTGLAQGRKVVGREIAGQLGGFCRASGPFPLKSPYLLFGFLFKSSALPLCLCAESPDTNLSDMSRAQRRLWDGREHCLER